MDRNLARVGGLRDKFLRKRIGWSERAQHDERGDDTDQQEYDDGLVGGMRVGLRGEPLQELIRWPVDADHD